MPNATFIVGFLSGIGLSVGVGALIYYWTDWNDS